MRLLQYRAKAGVVPHSAETLRDLTRACDALFLINDDWRAALRFDADGVHVGPDDLAAENFLEIRAALEGRILGVSCGTEAEARDAERAGADYLGVGSVFATGSKSDAGDPIGIAGLKRVAAATTLPVAAIGGITASNLAQVRQSGVAMAAMISAFAGADPQRTAAELVAVWEQT